MKEPCLWTFEWSTFMVGMFKTSCRDAIKVLTPKYADAARYVVAPFTENPHGTACPGCGGVIIVVGLIEQEE